MRLSGFSSIYSGPKGGLFPPTSRSAGADFLGEVKSALGAASAEKAKDTLARSNDDASLKALYEHLTPASKDVLERLEAEKDDIKKDEWLNFCKELKDVGAITQSDFDYTRADVHLILLGYHDESGNIVKYETSPMMKNKLLGLYESSRNPAAVGSETRLSADDWTGDPLEYLDTWTSELYRWRSDLVRMRNADGSPKYDNFTPITSQIDSCQKVAALVKELSQARF